MCKCRPEVRTPFCGRLGCEWPDKEGKVEMVPDSYLLQFFEYKHLPEHMQAVSKPFCELAHQLVTMVPSNPEQTAALRKLLEAKDCAVRAAIFK